MLEISDELQLPTESGNALPTEHRYNLGLHLTVDPGLKLVTFAAAGGDLNSCSKL